MGRWRDWQTQRIYNPPMVTPCYTRICYPDSRIYGGFANVLSVILEKSSVFKYLRYLPILIDIASFYLFWIIGGLCLMTFLETRIGLQGKRGKLK